MTCSFRCTTGTLPRVLALGGPVEETFGYPESAFLNNTILLREILHKDDSDIASVLFSADCHPAAGQHNIRIRHGRGHIGCFVVEFTKEDTAQGVIVTLQLQDVRSLPRTVPDVTCQLNFAALMERTDDFIYF